MEAVDDGLRVVRGREHTAIGFGLDFDAAFGEPTDGILGLPAVEGRT